MMDKTSRLIFEAFESGVSGADRFELEEFIRRSSTTTETFFDHMNIKDNGSKKRYTMVQIINKRNGEVVSTAIFDRNLPNDEGMIYHSISKDPVNNYEEFVRDFDSLHKSHSFYSDNKAGIYFVYNILKKFKNLPEKQRRVLAHNIKPETEKHFGDILESVGNDGFVSANGMKIKRTIRKDMTGELHDVLGKESSYIEEGDTIDIIQYSTPRNTIVAFQLIVIDDSDKTEYIEETSFYLRVAGNKLKYMTIIYGDELSAEVKNNRYTYNKFFGNKKDLYRDFETMCEKLDDLTLKKRKLILYMKPKTRKHFGDILG